MHGRRARLGRALLPALALAGLAVAAPLATAATTTRVVYDDFNSKPGAPYTAASYAAKWSNPYGLLDMALAPGDTRSYDGRSFKIDDAPFRGSADFSVFDHLKYIGVSNQAFAVPGPGGSITFSSQIKAQTPGVQRGRYTEGTYGPPGSFGMGAPYRSPQPLFEGQQAGAVMNMIDFNTGQLFDWFISGSRAFALVERLPSSVTGAHNDVVNDPEWVGPGKMYTQIVKELPAEPGEAHKVEITYTRGKDGQTATVAFRLDGNTVATVDRVGLPLDSPLRTKPVSWTGISSSATYPGGPPADGEDLGGKIQSFAIGHGLFTLLDQFPYQWGWDVGCPYPPASLLGRTCLQGSVSIPVSNRLFGQGARASFDDFVVTTKSA